MCRSLGSAHVGGMIHTVEDDVITANSARHVIDAPGYSGWFEVADALKSGTGSAAGSSRLASIRRDGIVP